MIRSMSRLALVLLLLAWPVAAAQGGHGHGAHGDTPAGSPMGGSPGSMPMGGGPAGGPMGGPMAGPMGDAMHALPADELGFLQHLIPHHAEAVASAERLLAITERPELQALLRDVIAVQSEEIERMRGWLASWFPRAGGRGMAMGGGMGMGPMHGRGAGGTFDATNVEALVRAFLAGAGGGEVGELHGPTVTFHVTLVVDDAERALVVDAATGEVRWADEP